LTSVCRSTPLLLCGSPTTGQNWDEIHDPCFVHVPINFKTNYKKLISIGDYFLSYHTNIDTAETGRVFVFWRHAKQLPLAINENILGYVAWSHQMKSQTHVSTFLRPVCPFLPAWVFPTRFYWWSDDQSSIFHFDCYLVV